MKEQQWIRGIKMNSTNIQDKKLARIHGTGSGGLARKKQIAIISEPANGTTRWRADFELSSCQPTI